MFGREFAGFQETLLSSFVSMNKDYRKVGKVNLSGSLLRALQRLYIAVFGIPEIGFQYRAKYFSDIFGYFTARPPKTVLDAGVGIGLSALMIKKRFPGAKILGTDIDRGKLAFLTEFLKVKKIRGISVKYEDLAKMKKKNEFDLIINIDVLEHVKDYSRVLENFYRSLKNGGLVYIHTPQPNQRRFFKRFVKWEHEEHVREGYEITELTKELESMGFEIVKTGRTFGIFGSLAWELNHLTLSTSFVIAGLTFPAIYLFGLLAFVVPDKQGLCAYYLLRKNEK